MYSLLQLLRHRPTLPLASLCGLACHVLPAAAVALPGTGAIALVPSLWTYHWATLGYSGLQLCGPSPCTRLRAVPWLQVGAWVQSLEGMQLRPGEWQMVRGLPREVISRCAQMPLAEVAGAGDSMVLHVERL